MMEPQQLVALRRIPYNADCRAAWLLQCVLKMELVAIATRADINVPFDT